MIYIKARRAQITPLFWEVEGIKLKHCPFCGGAPDFRSIRDFRVVDLETMVVMCLACDTRSPGGIHLNREDARDFAKNREAKIHAAHQWNERSG